MRRHAILVIAALAAVTPSFADESAKAGAITISAAWARATPKGAPVGGGYLTIANDGATPDRLIAASSPAAAKVELHQMRMEGNVMVMRALPDGIEIRPGQKVVLEPSGLHLMLIDPRQQLTEGGAFPVTLTFQNAGSVSVELAIGGMGARGPAAAAPMDRMHMNAPAGMPMHQH